MSYTTRYNKKNFFLNQSSNKFSLGNSPNKLNCSNTLSKFYNSSEEQIKKLDFFNPHLKKGDENLFDLKLVKIEKDAKKLEEKKNLDTLKHCIIL